MLRIKEVIKEQGFTQLEIADKLGISRVALAQQIGGKPSLTTLEKIANILNVEVWELLASPKEIQAKVQSSDLTALINHKGDFYKATTIDELEKIVSEIKEKYKESPRR